jgi:hypothetical protein
VDEHAIREFARAQGLIDEDARSVLLQHRGNWINLANSRGIVHISDPDMERSARQIMRARRRPVWLKCET